MGEPKTERRQTFPITPPNGKNLISGTLMVGLPLSVLVGWLVQAGEIKQSVSSNRADIAEVKTGIVKHEEIGTHSGVAGVIKASEQETSEQIAESEARSNEQIKLIRADIKEYRDDRKALETKVDNMQQQMHENQVNLLNAINRISRENP